VARHGVLAVAGACNHQLLCHKPLWQSAAVGSLADEEPTSYTHRRCTCRRSGGTRPCQQPGCCTPTGRRSTASTARTSSAGRCSLRGGAAQRARLSARRGKARHGACWCIHPRRALPAALAQAQCGLRPLADEQPPSYTQMHGRGACLPCWSILRPWGLGSVAFGGTASSGTIASAMGSPTRGTSFVAAPNALAAARHRASTSTYFIVAPTPMIGCLLRVPCVFS
jgi:hypothetical protein